MQQWSEKLVSKMFESGADQYDLSGLRTGMTGPQFEAALGDFLRRAEAFAQIKEVAAMTAKAPNLGGPQIQTWYEQVANGFNRINEVIVSSLMEEFHHNRLAASFATEAYRQLLDMARLPNTTGLVYATTNYDALGELALEGLGAHPDAGEPARQYGGQATGLDVVGLLDDMSRHTPVLHLHGKVGWYRDDRGRVQVIDTQQHHSSHGVPVVMLPDPNKSFAGDDVLALLWAQFQEAVADAGRILVLGHSLADRQLVNVLRNATNKLGITYLGTGADRDTAQLDRLRSEFGRDPVYFPVKFGPKLEGSWDLVARWLTAGERPPEA
jgi:SIR2-like protein